MNLPTLLRWAFTVFLLVVVWQSAGWPSAVAFGLIAFTIELMNFVIHQLIKEVKSLQEYYAYIADRIEELANIIKPRGKE